MDTLVLDVQGKPVEFVPWQRAVTLMYNRRVHVLVDDNDGRILHSPNFTIGMPRVIQLKNAQALRRLRKVPLTQRNLLIRDKGICQYCGKNLLTRKKGLEFSEVTKDHVVPRALGGKTVWTNIVLACMKCNKKKGCRTLAESGFKLLNEPTVPSVYDARFNFRLHIKTLRPEWEPWSSWLYWNIELDK